MHHLLLHSDLIRLQKISSMTPPDYNMHQSIFGHVMVSRKSHEDFPRAICGSFAS